MFDGFESKQVDTSGARINLLDMDTGRTMSIPVEGNPTGLGWDGSRFWYCDYTNIRLRAIKFPQFEE